MCVCVCMCVRMCVRVCAYVCVGACTCVRECARICVFMCDSINKFVSGNKIYKSKLQQNETDNTHFFNLFSILHSLSNSKIYFQFYNLCSIL